MKHFTLNFVFLVVTLIVFFQISETVCRNEVITLQLIVSPKSGIAPLDVHIRVKAHSNIGIRSVKLDLNEDKVYEVDVFASYQKTYEFSLTHRYELVDTREYSSPSSPASEVIHVLVEGATKHQSAYEVVQIFPKRDFEFSLIADVCSGSPPLEVNFHLVVSCDDCVFSMDCEGDGVYEFSQNTTSFKCRFTEEGLYPSTVSVSDKFGNYEVSEFFYCATQSPTRISRFIEVLFKLSVIRYVSSPYMSSNKIQDVYMSSAKEEYIAISGNFGIVIIKNRKIKEILLEPFTIAIDYAKFFEKDSHNVLLYFSSPYGAFKWSEEDEKLEKLSERSSVAFYPIGSSYLVLDRLRQIYGFCSDESFSSCSEFPLPFLNLYSKIRLISSDPLSLYAIIFDSFVQEHISVVSFPRAEIQMHIEKQVYPLLFPIHRYDLSNSMTTFVLVPSVLAQKFYVVTSEGYVETYSTPDPLRISFNTPSFLDENRILLGTPEFPCEIEGKTETCNKVIFHRDKQKFEKLKGKGEIVDSYSYGGRCYALGGNNLEILFPYSVISDSPYSVTYVTLPTRFLDFLYDNDMLYLASRGLLTIFKLDGEEMKFAGYSELPDGIPTSMHKLNDVLFVAISDDISTQDKEEGKIVVVDSRHPKFIRTSYIELDRLSGAYIGCISAKKLVSGDFVFVCDRNRLFIISEAGKIVGEVSFSDQENIKDIEITEKAIYAISDTRLYTLSHDGRFLDVKEGIMQFFGISVDNERKLLYTAEGQDHNVRIFDVSEVIPRELTRVSLDYGTHTDIASDVFYLGNRLFVASHYAGLLMFDVSNPSKPVVRKKTYFDEFSYLIEKCMAEDITICLSASSIIFIK